MCPNIKSDFNNLHRIPSRKKQGKYYTNDISIGMCECFIGCDGSPCTYQFVFITFTSTDERQIFARIALDTALPLTLYQPLHSSVGTEVNAVDLFSENDDVPSPKQNLKFNLCEVS